ncbi:DUF885 family protein [Caulobacter sp. NIBR1757]|uniref:DUF885 domain-containing protein n=1 Tax=Caulobacter sp. NIBR1757 TaxID=3016000 RepID=UPI0022F0E95E|nr:DUF885 family protein [Caulobacter sp. NIBR1757]WGM40716.1 hypothetical protein AMEJIAPC_03663 [Caulobacter sp. NIBR1757]
MQSNRRQLLLGAAAVGVVASLPLAACAPAAAANRPVDDAKLGALLDAFVTEILVASPETATSLGLDKDALAGLRSKLSDASVAGRRKTVEDYKGRLARLRAIDRKGLSERDTTLYDTVAASQELGAQGGAFSYGGDYANPYVISQQNGAVGGIPEFLNSQHLIKTRSDVDAYIARTEALAGVIDQETERFRADVAAGVTPPNFILPNLLGQLKGFRAQQAGETGLVKSVADRARAANIAGDFAAPVTTLVSDKIFPAIDRQIAAVGAAMKTATSDAGVWKLPQGEAYYDWGLKIGTTTTLTADEIHTLGLEQGKAIDAEMDALLKGEGFTTGTVGERVSALTKDPRQLYANTEAGHKELIAYLNGCIDKIRPHMTELSKLGLKAAVEVKAVPKDIQDGAALGYMNFASLDGSRPAIYYVNLKDTGNWPRYSLNSLTMHEAIPGHAWQGAYLAEKHDQIHTISSLIGFNAFVEGWALYAEQMADEVGMYQGDALGKVGYLQALRFRAARLVVDTGLHAKKWTRDQAIKWMTEATGRSTGAITSEVDRYCASPGQACGYKVGHTEIVRLREKARAALGAKFDIRDFNDTVVATGGTPLTVLGTVIDRYIAGAK